MGSNVAFDSPYLDRYLRLGWYLDIIILFLLEDASLTFRPDLVVDLDDWDYIFDDGWFEVIQFSDLPYIYAILGHIFILVEICRFPSICPIIPIYKIYVEMMTYLLSYRDLPRESLLSHSIKLTLFSIWMSSCFSFWETFLWSMGPIQLWTWMIRITHLVIDDLVASDFFHLPHIWCHTGAYFRSGWDL